MIILIEMYLFTRVFVVHVMQLLLYEYSGI